MRSAVFVAALALAGASLAHANGRAPVTNGVYFQATDPQAIYVRATFGLLISRDGGCTFRWVCEESIGYSGVHDPVWAIGDDGALFATTFSGLRVSRDGGCSFATATAELPVGAPGRIADQWVDALDIGPTGHVWAGTAGGSAPNDLYRSTDGGVTFEARGKQSPALWWKSVAVARSDGQRVYAAAYEVGAAPAAHVFSTVNGGDDWSKLALVGVRFAGAPMVSIAALDPANAQHLYIASIKANGAAGDLLYRSIDGGATFQEVLATTQPIANVAIRDATTVFAVAGDGTYRSDNGGASFAPAPASPRFGCLGARADGSLVGCATNWEPDFMSIGRSNDAARWEKIFRFVELAGPLACPAGTPTHDTCEVELWPGLADQFKPTGPLCGRPADLPAEPAASGGCCQTTDGAPLGAGLLLLLTALGLRGPRRAPDSSGVSAPR